jgi:DNA-binding CsgD family transcriptional regulator/PAS domain-containing protein
VRTEAASKLIGQIYASVLQPAGWPELLKLISSSGENAGSSIVVYDRWGGERSQLFEHGADQSHLRVYFEKLAAMKLTPGGRSHARTLGDVTTLTMLCGERESLEHDFYMRWVKPSGFRDMIGVLVLKSGKRLAWFSVARTEIQARYCDADLQFMDWLSPHICRAFTMGDIFDLQAVRIQQLEQTVDALSTGVFLTDRRGITYMNSSAQKLIDDRGALKVKDNRLTVPKSRSTDMLSEAISASLDGVAPPMAGTHMVPIPDEEGGGLIASVLPLKWRDADNPLTGLPGSAAILVQDPSQPVQSVGDAFGRLYGLTGAEQRISLEIARGRSNQDLCDLLGISTNTLKTHLKHIYAKTGVTRQTDLARLVIASTPPVRATGETREHGE